MVGIMFHPMLVKMLVTREESADVVGVKSGRYRARSSRVESSRWKLWGPEEKAGWWQKTKTLA